MENRETMNHELITTLAREYAADCIDHCGFSKDTYEEIIDEKAEDAAYILRWISRRFCLVEKDKIKEEWDGIDLYLSIALNLKYDSSMAERCASEKRSMLRSLFPEIAKEVELTKNVGNLEDKPAEPKFNDGDLVRRKSTDRIGELHRMAPLGYCFMYYETPYRITFESLDDLEDIEPLD